MKRLFFFFFSFPSKKCLERKQLPRSHLMKTTRETDDSDFDVYSEEDVGTMKTMELRRAAKRRKEGGVNADYHHHDCR